MLFCHIHSRLDFLKRSPSISSVHKIFSQESCGSSGFFFELWFVYGLYLFRPWNSPTMPAFPSLVGLWPLTLTEECRSSRVVGYLWPPGQLIVVLLELFQYVHCSRKGLPPSPSLSISRRCVWMWFNKSQRPRNESPSLCFWFVWEGLFLLIVEAVSVVSFSSRSVIKSGGWHWASNTLKHEMNLV